MFGQPRSWHKTRPTSGYPQITASSSDVVPVREVAGRAIYQAYIGSAANPGLRDFAIAALMVDGQQVHDAGVDASYHERAMQHQQSGSFIVGGRNYGQGSSREHAAIGPRYLGVKAVIAKSFARIHRQNLINFGILPLTFADPEDWNRIAPEHVLRLPEVREAIQHANQVQILNQSMGETYSAEHGMTERHVQMLLAGSLINLFRAREVAHGA